ncbi:hypothetical protein [Arthrobacter roseus]|uniref:hypothetical protein n=1 Tax=Arthrobacter roseus TaxID=136274 RepID=UPI0019647B51|nr:hypothetical protein [Arthrobacter roseus]MBM7849521.1 hypothetical protein [Arthrobacter roseus]
MSTPENNSDPQKLTPESNPYSGQAAPGSQPQYGQNGPDSAPGSQQPYGYQAPQASGYNYPGGAPETPAADKGPAPKQVDMAYWLILAAGALTLISAIIAQMTMPDLPGMSSNMVAAAGIVGLIFAIISVAIYVVLAIFIRKGHNWARITATVLASINVVIQVFNLISVAIASGVDNEMYASAPAANPFSVILGLIIMILGVVAVVLIWMKPARPYFQQVRPAGYAPHQA